MREERVDAGGVPTRVYDPGGSTGLLLLGHGGAHGKDSEGFISLGRRFAAGTGLAVACIDAVDHGVRQPAGPMEPGLPARWHSRNTARMVADWQAASASLASLGPPVAYVGFSMGVIFGLPTVAALPGLRAAVFMSGGVPGAAWVDDPPLEGMLLDSAGRISGPAVLMVNMSRDDVFPVDGTLAVFNAIPGRRKRLTFWDGAHDDWTEEVVSDAIAFLNAAISGHPPSS